MKLFPIRYSAWISAMSAPFISIAELCRITQGGTLTQLQSSTTTKTNYSVVNYKNAISSVEYARMVSGSSYCEQGIGILTQIEVSTISILIISPERPAQLDSCCITAMWKSSVSDNVRCSNGNRHRNGRAISHRTESNNTDRRDFRPLQ